MTVSSTVNREQYATNGVTTAFTIHFPFFNDADVQAVFVDAAGHASPLSLNADYTVSGGGGAGGSLVTTLAPAGGGTLTLYRELAFTQEDDYVEDDPLPADTLEGGFDRAVMRDQQLKDASDRALTFPPTIPPGVSTELPNPQADAVLGWNSAADGIENKTLESGTTVYASVSNTNAGLATHEAVTPYGLANSNLGAAVAAATAALAALALPTGYFNGFTLANNGADATHDIDVAAGKARSDADTSNLATSATIVKQTDVAFAEYVAPGTASGGMDSTFTLSGLATTVHVFMIGGAGKNAQPFFSPNINPTLPSGFTAKVYVHSLWWDGATIRPFKQRGRDEIELVTITTASIVITTNPATGARTIALGQFPTGLELLAKVELFSSNNTAAALTGLSPLDVTDQNPASATGMFDVYTVTNAAGQISAATGWVKTNTAGQIRARTNVGGAANVEQIATLGWRVMR
jgi:hypothetical protein